MVIVVPNAVTRSIFVANSPNLAAALNATMMNQLPLTVEYPHDVHLQNEFHGYDANKCAAVYPFLAKHLGLDLTKAINPDGNLNEKMIVIENQKALYSFDDKNPFPAHGIRSNDDVVWK